eukprot:CAMPEP_0175096448 /NCGR_PEP_ID=MMETSP0086_2-20121207/4740_1 /TAXON_ID=136419 /ORGANISM="Unknown Unknown, Strain D1" /LENGTH=919 /DNA_ID=CAMNT_0016369855 /DNA_START=130 /DNA_END=2889 /DNA_ORIENTATION=-
MMQMLNSTANSAGSNAPGNPAVPKSKALNMDGTVNLDAVDFEYVEACTNPKELRKVLTALEEDGYFRQLISACKNKLKRLDPKAVGLDWDEKVPATVVDEAKADILSWGFEIDKTDDALKSTRRTKKKGAMFDDGEGKEALPPVRGSRAARSAAEMKQMEAHAGIKPKKGVDKYANMSTVQREIVATREKDKGNECYRAKEFKDAVAFYTKSIELDPSNAVYLTNRAMAHLKLKNWEKAETDCDKAIEMEPDNVKAWWRRGSAKHGRIQYRQAIADFEKALELDPDNKAVAKAIQESKAKLHESDPTTKPKAEKMNRMQIEVVDDDDSDESDSGEEIEVPINKSKQSKTASTEIKKVPQKDVKESAEPDKPKWKKMQIVEDDEESESEDEVEVPIKKKAAPSKGLAPKSVTSEPDQAAVPAEELCALGDAELSAGRFSKAIKLYTDAGAALPSPPMEINKPWPYASQAARFHSNIGSCYTKNGDYEKAAQSCGRAIALAKESKSYDVLTTALLRRGVAYESLGQIQKAVSDIEAILALEPKHAKAQEVLQRLSKTHSKPIDTTVAKMEEFKTAGNKLFAAKKFQESADAYTAGVELFDVSAVEEQKSVYLNLCNNRALVYVKLGKYGDAITDCTKVLQLDPNNPKAFFRRGLAYKGQNRWDEALSDFENAHKFQKTANVVAELKEAKGVIESRNKAKRDAEKKAAQQKAESAALKERQKQAEQKARAEAARKAAAAKSAPKKPAEKWAGAKIEVIDSDDEEEEPVSSSPKPISAASPSKFSSRPSGFDSNVSGDSFPSPQSSVMFHRAWNQLKNNMPEFYTYFQKIKPSNLKVLFKASDALKPEHLETILTCLRDCYFATGKLQEGMMVLAELTKTGRFNLNIMLMPNSTSRVVKDIFSWLESSKADGSVVSKLKKLYE